MSDGRLLFHEDLSDQKSAKDRDAEAQTDAIESKVNNEREHADDLLNDLIHLKEAKESSGILPNPEAVVKLKNHINQRIEETLGKLLKLIMADSFSMSSLGTSEKDFRSNIATLTRNIENIEGKYVDGMLKSRLLFQFLKEYKTIQEERENEKKNMILDETVNSNQEWQTIKKPAKPSNGKINRNMKGGDSNKENSITIANSKKLSMENEEETEEKPTKPTLTPSFSFQKLESKN